MMHRRRFLACGAGSAAALAFRCTTTAESQDLDEATIADLQAGMNSGRFTARAIAEEYIRRIEASNRQGPALRAVIEVNPEALAIADALDAERRSRGPRGPLHGISVLLKDNIETADKMTTTAGSLALEGWIARRDSFVAERLRRAGAILLGKANMSEWANFRSLRSTSGWSARGGLCRNPYVLDRNPCGSSSGSAVAASANWCAAAIGTETDGSIVCPSSANGIVGIKPTVGLVSRSGIIPIAHSQDTAGPMARSVADAAAVLSAIVGDDPKDPATLASRGRSALDYTRFLDPSGLKGARIGVCRNLGRFNPEVDRLLEDAIAVMKQNGAEIIDPADIPTVGQFEQSELEVLKYEFKANINAYLSGLGNPVRVRSLRDLIEFNEKNKEREMPFFGQELFVESERKGSLRNQEYRSALERNRRLSRSEGIDFAVKKHLLDAIVAPTAGPAWETDLVHGDHIGGSSSTPAAVAGYPHITVPAGFVQDLPVGISFFGPAWSEPELIRIAYAYEQVTRHRRQPRFRPTLGA
jgi:amidase